MRWGDSHVFSFLPHLTVGLVVCQGICGGMSDALGMGPLLTGVYHPHFTALRVTDILLHTVRGGVYIRESSLPWPYFWPRGISELRIKTVGANTEHGKWD